LKAGSKTLLSVRGQVSVDARTNTLLVLETRERLAEIRNLVARLDIPVRQVLIESRIVIANNDYSKTLGTRFGLSHAGYNDDGDLVTTTGSAEGNDQTVQGTIAAPGTITMP